MKIRRNILEIDSLPDPSADYRDEDAYWPFRFVLGEVEGVTTLRVERTDHGRPSPGYESYASDADIRTLFSHLAGLVLPKVEREEHGASLSFYRAAGLRDNCFRPNGIVVSCTCKRVTVAEKVLTPEGARALAACLLAAADEADGASNG
jgi:hypothetical protein